MRIALIALAVFAALFVVVLAGARPLVLLLDMMATTGETKPATGPFAGSWGWMSVGETPLELVGPAAAPERLRIWADASGRVAFDDGDVSFPLGVRQSDGKDPTPLEIPFAPDSGDSVSFRVAHSVLAWPTPLELNFMTGNSPSWKRNVYYTLTWRKADGATLTLVWRYEQWFYDDWGSPQMTRAGSTGLVRMDVGRTP
jgi:hypothetical protein